MLDLFKPYSPKIRGPLEDYLRSRFESSTDTLFCGIRYFHVMQRKGLIVPRLTWVRINFSPAPDQAYFVNNDFMLESNGKGHPNMSCVGAAQGVYDPRKVLKRKCWSIHGLDLTKLFPTS